MIRKKLYRLKLYSYLHGLRHTDCALLEIDLLLKLPTGALFLALDYAS
jgi:hypothetical protein